MTVLKTTFRRLSGRTLAGLIRRTGISGETIYEPADLLHRLVANQPFIVTAWHGQFLPLSLLRPAVHRVVAIADHETDGELIHEAMRQLGIGVISAPKAAALRTAIRASRGGATVFMTADAAPGPARTANHNVLRIARLTGVPVLPVAAATARFTSFDTWSRMTVNLPSKKLAYVSGEPIPVPRTASADQMAELRNSLELALNACTERAYALAGGDSERTLPLDIAAAKRPPQPTAALNTYAAALSALRPAVPLLLRVRERNGKEDPGRRGERLGFAGQPRPAGSLCWVHAASVGETNAVLPVIQDLIARNRDLHVLLTTGTTTSAAIAERRLPERAMHQYVPLDVPQYVARFLDHWRPDLAIFTESDIWPNLVLSASKRAIPLTLVNARMSPRSQARWRKNRKHGRTLFARFHLVLAQDERVARAFKMLGAPRVITAGNLKIDAPPPPVNRDDLAKLKQIAGNRPVFLAASTHPGEETLVAEAHRRIASVLPSLLTIIVPRHPNRGAGLFAELAAQGLRVDVRSRGASPNADTGIYLADTLGELGTFYALAPVALLGGSLVEHGGQNPIEAIRLGAAVLSGPHYHNFDLAYGALKNAGGVQIVRSVDELARTVIRLFTAPAEARAMRDAANKTLAKLGGALSKTLDCLQPFIPAPRA